MKMITTFSVLLVLAIFATAQQSSTSQGADAAPQKHLDLEVFGNRLERQVWLKYHHKRWLINIQNQIAANGKSALTVPMVGYKFVITDKINFSLFGGPQQTYTNGKADVDRVVLFANGELPIGKLKLASINRIWFGKATGHRHIQKVDNHNWTLVADELLTSKGVAESHVGVERTWIIKQFKLSVNPNWDFAGHSFDIRLALSYRFF